MIRFRADPAGRPAGRSTRAASPPPRRRTSAERCRSGRTGRSRKPLCAQAYRGFESHPLRQLCVFLCDINIFGTSPTEWSPCWYKLLVQRCNPMRFSRPRYLLLQNPDDLLFGEPAALHKSVSSRVTDFTSKWRRNGSQVTNDRTQGRDTAVFHLF